MLSVRNELSELILACDPLVCDTACQIRACTLLQIYTTLQNNPQYLPISDQDYINHCRILTSISEREMDVSDTLISEKTDLSKISKADIEKYGLSSNKKKEHFVGKIRLTVADQSLKQFRQLTPQLKYDDGLLKYFQDDYLYIENSKSKIPIIPFYLSVKMMLNFLYQYNKLLILNIKQYLSQHNENQLVSAKTICFRYAGEELVRQPNKSLAQDEVGLAISMVTTNETFLNIKDQPIDVMILLSAAAHFQTPLLAKGNIDECQKDFVDGEKPAEPKPLIAYKNEVNQCSIKEYKAFRDLAHQYNLIKKEKNSTSPVFCVEHVYLSTLEKSKQHKREYLEKMQNLKLFTPRKMADSHAVTKEIDHVHTI